MKNFKKIAITATVFTGLLFAGNQAMALQKNQNSLMQKITAMTQIMELTQEYPQLKEMLQPILDTMIADLIADITAGNTVTKSDKNTKPKKSETKKTDTKKYNTKKQNQSFDITDIENIEADRYESIDGKWEIEIDFKDNTNKKDIVFYVYNIDNENELISNITTQVKKQFGLTLTSSDIQNILDIDND